jgi:predicted DNA-binding transcriptional regulator YafY
MMLRRMRRADRLFSIVLELRRRPVTTAAQLAEHLEVSVRTIYRDVADLVASGIPIDGEAGVGYRLGHDFELPPLMFTLPEVQALVLGVRMVEAWGDGQLRTAARAVLGKVEAVLPDADRHRIADTALFALSFWVPEHDQRMLGSG